MFKWVQSGLSAAIGTAEPEYGREAIQTISDQVEKENLPVYREAVAKDFAWQLPECTNVETQSFYFTCLKTGLVGFIQIIHSNIVGETSQFTFRLYNYENGKPEKENLWTSTKLENFKFEGENFYADGVSFELIDDEKFHLKSDVNPSSVVDVVVEKLIPGVIFGKDGVTNFGEDPNEPWGSVRHLFLPRCAVSGTIKLDQFEEVITLEGYGMLVMAIQGMKPHHVAKAWNFLTFQNENYSAIQMEWTTPLAYATTKVNVGILATNDKILNCSLDNEIIHLDPKNDDEVDWPVPQSIEFKFNGSKASNSEYNTVEVKGDLKTLIERVDVMAEIPQFIKNIATGVSGAKPYIYQFCNNLQINIDGKTEEGLGFNEVTFISE